MRGRALLGGLGHHEQNATRLNLLGVSAPQIISLCRDRLLDHARCPRNSHAIRDSLAPDMG